MNVHSVWHRMSCISLCSKDFRDLERSSVAWLCDSINSDSFTFRTYETQTSNYYEPIYNLDSTLNSVFSPLHTSSPVDRKSPMSDTTRSSTRSKNRNSSSQDKIYSNLPHKQNLRIMTVNCRSVKENNSEFKTAVNYIKPSIICGTES